MCVGCRFFKAYGVIFTDDNGKVKPNYLPAGTELPEVPGVAAVFGKIKLSDLTTQNVYLDAPAGNVYYYQPENFKKTPGQVTAAISWIYDHALFPVLALSHKGTNESPGAAKTLTRFIVDNKLNKVALGMMYLVKVDSYAIQLGTNTVLGKLSWESYYAIGFQPANKKMLMDAGWILAPEYGEKVTQGPLAGDQFTLSKAEADTLNNLIRKRGGPSPNWRVR
jgi:hypothetical protein